MEAGRPGLPGGRRARHRETGRARRVLGPAGAPTANPGWRTRTTPWWPSHHRGHRLGMLVKILQPPPACCRSYPAVERIVTFNAAENDHMLVHQRCPRVPSRQGTTANGRRPCERPVHHRRPRPAARRRRDGTCRRPAGLPCDQGRAPSGPVGKPGPRVHPPGGPGVLAGQRVRGTPAVPGPA